MKNFLGDKIYARNASWSFDKKVPKNAIILYKKECL